MWVFFFKYFKYEFQAWFKLVLIHHLFSLFKAHNKEWSTQRHDRLVMGFALTTKVTKSSWFCLHRWCRKLKRFLKTSIIWHYQMLYILLNPDFFFFWLNKTTMLLVFLMLHMYVLNYMPTYMKYLVTQWLLQTFLTEISYSWFLISLLKKG